MKKEQTFLLSLLSSSFDPTATIPAPELSPAEWKRLIVESFCQAVGYLTFSLYASRSRIAFPPIFARV